MNKVEANISLFIITFFSAIQYVFLAGVPADMSRFAFMCITNLIGFSITLAFFFGELFRLDVSQIKQSAILSSELIAFNLFMLMGVGGVDAGVASAVLSSYFVFVLLFESVISRTKPNRVTVISVTTVLIGLFFMMNADAASLMHIEILYLILADVAFAIYVMNVGSYAASSNPSILAMGQMFFCFVFSLVLWIGEAVFMRVPVKIPFDRDFWIGVIYISFFIRGLYGIIQIYAQRYVTPLNTSLIFSSEIVMAMLISPVLSSVFDTEPELITPLKVAGSVLIILGLLIIEPGFLNKIRAVLSLKVALPQKANSSKISASRKIFVVILVAIVYILMDIPVSMSGFFPDYAGIKNAMPFVAGLFFGFYGVAGCCVGCVVSSLFLGRTLAAAGWECWCVAVIGLCVYYGWHAVSKSHRITFKSLSHYVRYALLSVVASLLCFDLNYTFSYLLMGILIALPVDILFGSLLYVEPFTPSWCAPRDDAFFDLESGGESLERANEFLQDTAEKKGVNIKRVFEIQSCLEELAIRIFNAIPDTKIQVRVIYYNAISMRLDYAGVKYNPFKINKNEDVLDIMGLKIIKHRALRASFTFHKGKNKVHVVM